MNKPTINVTPLIDVLLVLLIIFMVVAPLKPSAFNARVPAKPDNHEVIMPIDPKTLVVAIDADGSLRLNAEERLGTANDTEPLIRRLEQIFELRRASGDVSEGFADATGRPYNDRIERTVFIKAPMGTAYGVVVRVVDAAKLAGAFPISLQVDSLD